MAGKQDIQKTMSDIRDLKSANKTDKEIMESLKIPERTYYRYCSRIHEKDKTIWNNMVRTQLEPELMKLKESLEHTYDTCKKRADGKGEDDDFNIGELLRTKDEARANIVRLLVEGPAHIKRVKQFLEEKNEKEEPEQEQGQVFRIQLSGNTEKSISTE